mgnify:CR=1 FL=1
MGFFNHHMIYDEISKRDVQLLKSFGISHRNLFANFKRLQLPDKTSQNGFAYTDLIKSVRLLVRQLFHPSVNFQDEIIQQKSLRCINPYDRKWVSTTIGAPLDLLLNFCEFHTSAKKSFFYFNQELRKGFPLKGFASLMKSYW